MTGGYIETTSASSDTDFADPLNHKGERLFTGSLAVAYGVRELESRVGCFYCDASMVMTAEGRTFQKNF